MSLHMLFSIDPAKLLMECIVIAVFVLIVIYMYRYWGRVVFLLTGDDRLHAGTMDLCWWSCFRCGGLCNGECTRYFTALPCCWCIRDQNLVKVAGRLTGVATYSVELKNIVVGDLPHPRSVGNFYLAVECATNPPMVTSLAEEKPPKVVHFPEVLTLRLRKNILEHRVRICVRELNIVGSVDLCELHLTALNILDWSADDPEFVAFDDDSRKWRRSAAKPETDSSSNTCFETRLKRFQMRVLKRGLDCETPPWICIEFTQPTEPRNLETLGIWSNFRGAHWSAVRTWGTRWSGDEHGNYTKVSTKGDDSDEKTPYDEVPVVDFKGQHPLLDPNGNVIKEPNEEVLSRFLRKIAWCNCT